MVKVLLYTESEKTIGKSGLGKAIQHQKKALEENHIEYTENPKEINSCDIVHINFFGPKSYFLAKKAKKLGKKVIYHAHSTKEDFKNSFLFSNQLAPLFKWWICKCYRLGDYIISPTPYSKKIQESYGLHPIEAISNGIDMKFFKKDKKQGEQFRKTYGYSKDDKVVIGIGLYLERKGILDFVELAKRMKDYQFIWFGYLNLNLVPRKIRRAVNTKLPNLTFAGYVEQEMIRSALSGGDIYFFPTLEETEGIPILEAFSTKIDTVIRDIPIFEWIKDKKEVYKGKTLEDFEYLIRGITNKELPSLVENAYLLAKQCEIKTVGKKMINVYYKVLEEDDFNDKKTTIITTKRKRVSEKRF